MSALKEIGFKGAARFGVFSLLMVFYRVLIFPQLRAPFLRLLGAGIGSEAIIHDVHFFNYYRRGFPGLTIGRRSFLGNECLIDLAEAVTLEDEVTLAERVTILTHRNVGYQDHPLQMEFPPEAKPVIVRRGSFIGANVTILCGVEVGERSFIAAGSVVTANVPPDTLMAGVPARAIRKIKTSQVTS